MNTVDSLAGRLCFRPCPSTCRVLCTSLLCFILSMLTSPLALSDRPTFPLNDCLGVDFRSHVVHATWATRHQQTGGVVYV
jgi:hypothetical protein